ncbi:MAG: exodeoxyribonuclease VII large subunit [Pseudomonadota bacterium]
MFEQNLFERKILTVSDLTGRLKDLIESEFGLIWVAGEISNLKRPSSGHIYFTLKDETAQIRAVMFRTKQRYLDFNPADGQEVLARGRLTLYEPRGEYQLVVEFIEPRGEGALRLAFEKMKQRLAQEGLFDPARKKNLPFLPLRVAVVTSPTGAAVRDFIRVSRRRFENTALLIYPVRVQGEGAAAEIAAAVDDINRWEAADVIVLTRGGGSLEDLWAFNEEIVARAAANSHIPVVSAVGHEIDFTIADFVSDLRAPTPSAAAELIFREKAALKKHIEGLSRRLAAGIKSGLNLTRERLAHFQTKLGDPGRVLADRRLRVDDFLARLSQGIEDSLTGRRRDLRGLEARLAPQNPFRRLASDRARLGDLTKALIRSEQNNFRRSRDRFQALTGRLGDLSPLAVLNRGYALARRGPDLKPLKSSAQTSPGESLNLLLAEGELDVVVKEVLK